METTDPIITLCEELRVAVQAAYESGVTMEDAEKMAARTLAIQLELAVSMAGSDLDARMKKNGVKAKKSVAYMTEINKHDKKPSEGFLEQSVNGDISVQAEQDLYDRAESRMYELRSYLEIFKDAHIYYRSVMKGSFNG